MQKFSILVETEAEARDAVHLLWDTWGVRGEIELVPMDGRYKLDIIAEKDLTSQQLEKLPGKRN